jgi:hypothetical protein
MTCSLNVNDPNKESNPEPILIVLVAEIGPTFEVRYQPEFAVTKIEEWSKVSSLLEVYSGHCVASIESLVGTGLLYYYQKNEAQ